MEANSTSNDSLFHPKVPSGINCFFTRPASLIFTSFTITKILLLLPLCILIIYLGLQRWRHQRSTSAAAAMTSHSDVFTYNMVAVEMGDMLGCIINLWSVYGENISLIDVGYGLWSFTWYGEVFFHILTCVERYLAVVHPVTYLSLRGERGTRIRNISIGCVWLLCCVTTGVVSIEEASTILYFGLMIFSLTIISFFSLSVLLVLIRPGPGEQGGDRDRVHQSKKRAFYTILAILGVLLFRFCGNVGVSVIYELQNEWFCVFLTSQVWFNLPSSLVLPLLFLQKAGKLACFENCIK